jgi:hypothetical protein
VHTEFWWENLRDLSVDGIIIFEWIFKEEDLEGVYWIDVAQNKDRWRAVLKVGIKFQLR